MANLDLALINRPHYPGEPVPKEMGSTYDKVLITRTTQGSGKLDPDLINTIPNCCNYTYGAIDMVSCDTYGNADVVSDIDSDIDTDTDPEGED